MKDGMLRVEEVAVQIGRSVKTINSWYKFKQENPQNKIAKLLPNYMQEGSRQTRYWKKSDVAKLIEFRDAIPQGVVGIMGSVTQKYVKKEKKDGKNNEKQKVTE